MFLGSRKRERKFVRESYSRRYIGGAATGYDRAWGTRKKGQSITSRKGTSSTHAWHGLGWFCIMPSKYSQGCCS